VPLVAIIGSGKASHEHIWDQAGVMVQLSLPVLVRCRCGLTVRKAIQSRPSNALVDRANIATKAGRSGFGDGAI